MIRFLFPSSLENDKLFIGTSGLRVQLPVIGKAVTNQSSKTGRGNFHEIAPIILRKEKWGPRIIVNNQNFHFFVSMELKNPNVSKFWQQFLKQIGAQFGRN